MKLSDSVNGLQHIGIPSEDIQKSIAFYEALGFTKIYETMNGEEKVAFMELGNLVLELYGNRPIKGERGAIDHIATARISKLPMLPAGNWDLLFLTI